MFWYFFLLAIVCCDFALEEFLKRKGVLNKPTKLSKFLNFVFKYRLITVSIIVFMATFKSVSVGADTGIYKKCYDKLFQKGNIFKLYIGNRLEIGYAMLTWLLALMNMPFAMVSLVISCFVAVCVVVFVNKLSPNKFMSIILFVALGIFAQMLNAYRQIIAVAFVLLAITRLVDKKWISASLLILGGCLFHISAAICFILIPLNYIKPKWWIVVSCFAFVIVSAFVFPDILKLVEKLTPLDYYTKYYVQLPYFLNGRNIIDTLYTIAICAVFVVMYCCKFKLLKFEDEQEQKRYDFFLLIFMLVALIRIAGLITGIPQLLNRLNSYFFIILIVLIPLFVKDLKYNKKLYTLANIAVYAVAMGYMIYLYGVKNTCFVVPYSFMF